MRREKQRSLFDEPAAVNMATHCVGCHQRLAQLEGVWAGDAKGWLCDNCSGRTTIPSI